MESKLIFRVLMFPWLAHGHVFPFLELAKRLSRKNFKIYFCSTSINLDSIKKSFNLDEFSIELVELQLPSTPELPPQYHTTKNIPPNLMPTLMQAFQDSSSNFSNIITKIKPDLLIYDAFQPWAAKFASSQGIPSVHFSTSGSTQFSFFHHFHTYRSFDTFPYPAIYHHEYETRDLFTQGGSIKVKDAGKGFVFGIFDLSHEIVLIKSCKVIEDKYIDYFSELSHKRVVPVGSLITRNNEKGNESEILKWLSTKNKFSTLYISFGSENYLSKDQIEEIAKGLELSNVNFIWDRGIVEEKWAPQAEILSHENVGGFMSHCGWSSVMESVYFGVPIVAVPLKLDQPLNSRLVVEIGVGVEVKRDESGKFNGENVVEAISKVIVEESGEGFRCKVRELSEKVKMEEEEGFDEVAEQLSNICMEK
ncbi:hypothetical protein RD792_017154 [Penstemon davidsonii]|uniref:Glycosyltransferase n=1 Tax=Penstemon davidsonii TaxID=160366 RepID=A0ABR0CL95_9LAMI|nr:hypothetical protein RD792_017154 [Penstemon davidsonii]